MKINKGHLRYVNLFAKSDLCELLRGIQKDYSLLKVAEDLGKNYRSWQVELSPYADAHKLGLFDVLNTLFITKKPFPVLQFICNLYDHHAVPNAKKTSTEDKHRLVTRIMKEIGDVSGVFLDVTDPNSDGGVEITPEERAVLLKEIGEAKQYLNQLESSLKG